MSEHGDNGDNDDDCESSKGDDDDGGNGDGNDDNDGDGSDDDDDDRGKDDDDGGDDRNVNIVVPLTRVASATGVFWPEPCDEVDVDVGTKVAR